MFRRTKSDTAPAPVPTDDATGTQKKGRPTPSRKEAEAANKARAKVPRTRKELAAARRLERSTSSTQMRQAMKGGDQRYLPARDQGPVRHFVRDYVDSRFSLIELLIPLMFMVLLLGWTGSSTIRSVVNLAMLSLLVLIVVDLVRLRFRLRRELSARFPDADLSGTTYYAAMRSMSMRFMRMPKAQVKVGEKLPERYR